MVLLLSYIDQVNEKRSQQTNKQQSDAMMQLAMLSSQKKPSVILTDSTDLGEHIAELGDKIIDVMEAVRSDKSTQNQLDGIASLINEFKTLSKTAQEASQNHASQVIDAIDSLKKLITTQKPIVVPAPRVTVEGQELTLDPIIEKLDQLLGTKDTIDISKFRVHDLDNGPDRNQYISFMDMDGRWYIMQHDPSNNRARYFFSNDSYDMAWDDKYSHEYTTLNEAMRALRS